MDPPFSPERSEVPKSPSLPSFSRSPSPPARSPSPPRFSRSPSPGEMSPNPPRFSRSPSPPGRSPDRDRSPSPPLEFDDPELDEGESPKKKQKKSTKRKRADQAEDPNDDAYETAKAEVEAEERQKSKYELIEEEMRAEFDAIKATGKTPRTRKKNDETKNTLLNQYNDQIETLAERMVDAYLDDKKANAAGKLATAKLKMLPEVIAMLHKRNPAMDVQLDQDDPDRPIANKNFLKACKQWLTPLPDGSLPSLKIREGILKNLHKLEVDSTVLIDSQIGAAVHGLYKHKQELPANKKLCRDLIAKWSRPIFNVPSNYSALQEIEPMTISTPPAKRLKSEVSSSSLDAVISGQALRTSGDDDDNKMWYPRKFTAQFDSIRRPTKSQEQEREDEEEEKRTPESSTAKQLKDRMSRSKKVAGNTRAFSVKMNKIPRTHERR